MKRGYIIGVTFALLLAACGKEVTVGYRVALRAPDAARTMVLLEAVERVMIRKLTAQSIKNPSVLVVPSGTDSATLTVKVPDANTAAMVRSLTEEQFTFDLRIEESPKDDKPEEKFNFSRWQPVGITGALVTWAQAVGNRQSGEIGVNLTFNEAGTALLKEVFARNTGKNIGIFVRGLLVSKLKIASPDIGNTLSISGIPSAAIAEVFADDVDVGLLTTVQALP